MILNTITQTDCLEGLRLLPDNSIDCCVTSPPYFGLRDYGTGKWEGGNKDCDHKKVSDAAKAMQSSTLAAGKKSTGHQQEGFKQVCGKCGAIRNDNQIGLEKTPEAFVAKMVEVFGEVKRVLKKEGTLWLNLGDSFGSKNLMGIPWMVAFALRSAGWCLRQDIIWHKPNPMPESVKDRCTKAHEYIFMLTKSAKYYYDAEAIAEPAIYAGITGMNETGFKDPKIFNGKHSDKQRGHGRRHAGFNEQWDLMTKAEQCSGTRNKRSVWSVPTKPFADAHFATFPEDLIVDCIKAGCPENGIVLDPFMGAGTTALVASKLNRNYIGFELNPDYIRISERRLATNLGMFNPQKKSA